MPTRTNTPKQTHTHPNNNIQTYDTHKHTNTNATHTHISTLLTNRYVENSGLQTFLLKGSQVSGEGNECLVQNAAYDYAGKIKFSE